MSKRQENNKKKEKSLLIEKQFEIRLIFIIVFFFLLTVLLYLGTSQKVSPEEAKTIVEQAKNLIKNIVKPDDFEATAQNIFLHNAYITVLANAPFLGMPLIMYSAYQTGLTAKMIIVASGNYTGNLFYEIFFKPHAILELIVYSIAASESLFTTLLFLKKEEYSILTTIVIIILELSLLFFASLIESELITGMI